MKKDKLYDFLIVLLLYIAVSAFPFSLIFKNSEILVLISQCIIQIAYGIFSYFYTKKKTKLETNFSGKKVNWLIFLPCFLVCGSNFLYFAFVPQDISVSFEILLIAQIALSFLVAFNEEKLFRLILINNIEYNGNLKIILFSATVFALCHITSFISSFNPADLLIVIYTFLLGLVLGLIYLFTGNFVLVFLLHALFNIINKNLFESICGSISNIWFYLLANALVVIVIAAYLLPIYLKKLRNFERKI